MNEDMSQFLGVFLDEASEQIAILERDILILENVPSWDLLHEIFRAAHTLKGSSRAMGFAAMGDLTHAMEDVFDQLRHGDMDVTREMIDALFAGLDMLKAMRDEVAASGTTTLEAVHQTRRLRGVLGQQEAQAGAVDTADPSPAATITPSISLSETERAAVNAAIGEGCAIFQLTIKVVPDCMMKSVRAVMVLNALEQVSSVLSTSPSDEALENEEFDTTFQVLVASEGPAGPLGTTVLAVTDVLAVEVVPWLEGARADEDPYEHTPTVDLSAVPRKEELIPDERPVDVGPAARVKSPSEIGKGAVEKKGGSHAQTVRVEVTRLDNLLNLVGELVIDRTRIAQLALQFEKTYKQSELAEQLNQAAAHVGRITDELQDEIMKARMLPIDAVFDRFPRMMRDLAQKLGKDINFVVEGKETELDRSVIEVIGDPLIHMLRNSVDHGIEAPEMRELAGKPRAGSIYLRARHQENHIVIEFEDDGKGMSPHFLRESAIAKGMLTREAADRLSDKEAISLIFAAGFSTVDVISDVSGRGVGMDIVRSNLDRLGATVEIESAAGVGTKVTVRLPLTLAIIRALLVTVETSVYAIPLAMVIETLRLPARAIHVVNHREIVLQRGAAMPIVRLRDVLPLQTAVARSSRSGVTPSAQASEGVGGQSLGMGTPLGANESSASVTLIVVGQGRSQVGLIVDSLLGEQEVVIKSLGRFVGDIQGISGATILGNGRVALIIDVNGIIQIAMAEKGRAYAA